VPLKATTAPITLTNSRGTVSSPTAFTLKDREAFDFALTPAAIQTAVGGSGSTRVRLVSTGLNPYPYGVTLAVAGLPAGVTASFDRPTASLNQDAILTLASTAAAASGSYA